MKVSRELEAKILAQAGLAPDARPDRSAPDLIAPHVEVRADGSLVFEVPCVMPSLSNSREWRTRNRVAQAHRRAASRAFGPHLRELGLLSYHLHHDRGTLAVTVTRLGGRALDKHDNLPASAKYLVDGICLVFGIDDADPRLSVTFAQQPGGASGARIELRRA